MVIALYFVAKTYLQRNMASGVAPEISAQLLNGNPVLLSQYRGKPLLLHFWASWCSICNIEHDSIQSLSQSYPLISVAMASGDVLQVQEYMTSNSLTFPTIADANSAISRKFGVTAVPANFILNPQGKIVFTETGYTSEWGLRLRLWLAGL